MLFGFTGENARSISDFYRIVCFPRETGCSGSYTVKKGSVINPKGSRNQLNTVGGFNRSASTIFSFISQKVYRISMEFFKECRGILISNGAQSVYYLFHKRICKKEV